MAIRTQIVVCGGTGCMSSHDVPVRIELTKTSPVASHECTSKPMILRQYHTARSAEAYLRTRFFIPAAKIQICAKTANINRLLW